MVALLRGSQLGKNSVNCVRDFEILRFPKKKIVLSTNFFEFQDLIDQI